MKILFFIRSFEVGGSQRQIAMLAGGMAQRGHDVVVAVFYGGGPNEAALVEKGARVVVLEKSGRWDIVGPLWRLWRVLRVEKPEVVYPFLPTQTSIATLMLLFSRACKLVFGIRATNMVAADMLSAFIYRLEGWLSKHADLIVSNSSAGRADAVARGMPADRVIVVSNGIDTEASRPDAALRASLRAAWNIADDEFVVGMVARIEPMKDHENLLDAAALFLRDNPDARFVVVGNGTDAYRGSVNQHAVSLGIADRVRWVDACDDARAAYNAFDISTLSSAYGESFPNAVGEAMACGKLVAATDLGDVATIIGEYGEVVPPRRPELLCAAWTRLRSRLRQRPNCGMAARDHVLQRYSAERTILETERALHSLF